MEAAKHRSLGPYELIEELGRGAMGVVYLAWDPVAERRVAVKTLNGGVSIDDRDLERLRRQFVNEAHTGGALFHPGIVAIHDLVDDFGAGEIYVCMEYVPGTDLEQILARRDPLPLEFACDVVTQVADVLDYAHSQGLVHRDIKPANILIGDDRRVKVTDFGIAQLKGSAASGLESFGTPHYLAPERLRDGVCDDRGDVWALGVVLYRLLTRHLPFDAAGSKELAEKVVNEPPAAPRQHVPDLLPALESILEKALAKDPEERYQSAGDLARALSAVLDAQSALSGTRPTVATVAEEPLAEGRVADATPAASVGRPAALFAGRRARIAASCGLGAALLLAFLGFRLAAPATDAGPTPTPEQQRRLAYAGLLSEAQQLLAAGDSAGAARLFARAEEISPDTGRILRLREEARQQAESEIAGERQARIAELLAGGEESLRSGRLEDAAAAVEAALSFDPEHEAALAMGQEVEAAVDRRRAHQRSRRAQAAPPPEPVETEPAEAAPAPVIVEPIVPRPAPAVADFAQLKIDFLSLVSRGVLTLYSNDRQVLRRQFRFVEKKGLLRSRSSTGGFDTQVRLPAGAASLRIYLSLPGRETQVVSLEGRLPGGTMRSLQVRIAEDGEMTARFH